MKCSVLCWGMKDLRAYPKDSKVQRKQANYSDLFCKSMVNFFLALLFCVI